MSNPSLTPDSFMAQQKGTLTPDSFMAQQTNSQGEQLGFLDRTIPLDSYGNATLSGLQTVGRGVRDAVKGVGAALDPREDASGTGFASVGAAYPIVRMGEGAVDTAKKATQVPAAVRDINASPDPAGTYAKVGQETAGQGAGQALTALATEGAVKSVPPVVRGLAKGTNKVLEKAPGSIGAAAGAAVGHATGIPGATEMGAAAGYAVGREVLPKLKVPGENFGLPKKAPTAPTGEPLGPPTPEPVLIKSTALADANTPAVPPALQTGEALGQIPLPQRGSIAKAMQSPTRTLPGQIPPEVIQPPTPPAPQTATPIPPRSGLSLPPAPAGAELTDLPVKRMPSAAQTGEALAGPQPTPQPSDALYGVKTPETTPAAQQSAATPPPPQPAITRGSIKQMMDAMQSQLTERQMGAIAKKLDPALQGDPYANLPHKMTPVDSSAISKIGYDAPSQSAVVEWKNGTVYHHPDVPPEVYDQFANSESLGKHFSANMRNQYPGMFKGFTKKIGRGAIAAAMSGNP